ncbi:hypothetical protein B0H67DRAFT_610963 [Lasiosphaeris hirsuta]|uniref:DUF6604 domain-containing protein n=1 Tax=Lasiosphaeris hirsuta TaxID=260670 RepID=A0AA40A7E6_9PEZI|nr:hypothetical protein B0H67DRAFT_610963 [Lasiosphaeris hirsuta]
MSRPTSTYQQYKADTRLFVSWLATTAKANGWSQPSDSAVASSPAAPSPAAPSSAAAQLGADRARDSKKSRRRKKRANPAPDRPTPTHTVAIDDFVPMANFVVGKSASLSSSIADVLNRVIRLREGFAKLLQQRGLINPEETTAKNHSCFVNVLKRVRDILGDVYSPANADNGGPPSSPQCLPTTFAALYVHEPSQAFLDAPDVALQVPAAEYDIAEDEASLEEDAQVAFAALLVADGDEINVDAYDFSKKTIYEAYHLLDQFREACRPKASQSEPGLSNEVDDSIPGAKEAAGTGRDTVMLPLYNGQPYGWYEPEKAETCRSSRDKYNRDRAGFAEMLSDTAILAHKLKWNNVQDELTRGVRLIMADPSRPIPFWVVFTAQVLLGNLDILGGEVHGTIHLDVSNISRWIDRRDRRMKVALSEMGGKPRPPGWPAKKDAALRRLQQDANSLKRDTISRWKRRLRPSIERPDSILMARSAVFAGVLAHHLLTLYHTTAIAYVNAWGAVFAMSQLNTAVTRLSWFKTRRRPEVMWTAMLLMEFMQDETRFWVGQAPQDIKIKDFWKLWCLCQGVSLTDFAASDGALPVAGTSQNSARNANPRRGLVELATVSLLFRGRLGNDATGRARVNMTMEDVRKILGEGDSWTITEGIPGSVSEMVYKDARASSRPFRQGSSDNTRSRGRGRPSLTQTDNLTLSPAPLIKTLASALQTEIAELHFDYFGLHYFYWAILKKIRRNYDSLFRKANENRPDYNESEAQLPELVGIIFRAAAGKAPGLPTRDCIELLDTVPKGLSGLLDNGMHELVVDSLSKLGMAIEFEAS